MYHRSVLSPATGLKRQAAIPADMSVCFDDVCFGYDDTDHNVLKGVSFSIAAGQMTALAGHVGAGKRSCAHLLQRLGDVGAGAVRIGDTDVRDLPPETLQTLVALVPRDCRLQAGTVRDTLGIARAEATPDEIEAAARSAQVHEAVMRLAQGYDTPYEAWRVELSPGERQRLALAGAVLAGAPILILDETLSRLSVADEEAWQKAISTLRRGRTVLLISHRLSSLKMADSIVVMEHGLVVEEGRHAQLVAWNDRYTHLIATQTLRD